MNYYNIHKMALISPIFTVISRKWLLNRSILPYIFPFTNPIISIQFFISLSILPQISIENQVEKFNMLRKQLPVYQSNKKSKVLIDVLHKNIQKNHYQIGDLLGQGTFGKVYEAKDIKTGEKVAIKQVYQDKRFKNRELDVISRLENDNIIFMRDYYFLNKKQDQYMYLVMDFYETSLQSFLKEKRKTKILIEEGVRKILAFQLFKALYYLQNNNVLHRDLKPPNILLNPETLELRICDFGSAKILEKREKNVSYICSRYYRAPQLIFQYQYYKTEIDVWSAGCILAELITRQPVFPGDSTIQQLIQIIKIIGTPPKQYLQKYAPEIGDYLNLPDVPPTGWKRVLKKYNPEPEFVDLLEKIMVYDLKQRYTPFQILKHQYFHDLSSSKYEHLVQKLPNLFDFTRLRGPKNAKQVLQLQRLYILPNKIQTKIAKIKDSQYYKMQTTDSTPQPPLQISINQKKNQNESDQVTQCQQNPTILLSSQ